MLIGVLFSLLAGVGNTSKQLLTKITTPYANDLTITFASRIGAVIILFPVTFFLGILTFPTAPEVQIAVFIGGAVYAISNQLITMSVRRTDVSIVSPMLAFAPIFVIPPAFIILGEQPTFWAGIGIILVTIGAYFLNISTKEDGLLKPFKALKNDTGARLALLAVIIAAPIPSVNSLALQTTDPIFLSMAQLSVSGIILGIFGIKYLNSYAKNDLNTKSFILLLFVGGATGILYIGQFTGYQFIDVAYVQAIKRVSVLLSVLGGHYLLNEEEFQGRLIASLLIIIGIFLIGLFG